MTVQGLFITGTDTGVGKTVVTAAILSWLQQQGGKVGVMKSIETGVDSECSSAANSDALFLKECGNLEDDLAQICPIRLKPAASPYQASLIENRSLHPETILSAYRQLSEKYDWILVEGVGGLKVPITREYSVLDLICELGLPAVVVARYQLGTLNHTLMTVDTLKQKGVPVRGIVFNQTEPGVLNSVEEDQPRLIAELSGVNVPGQFPYIKNLISKSFTPEKLKVLGTTVDFPALTRTQQSL